MPKLFMTIYAIFFARKSLRKFHIFLIKLGLRGIGILNFQNNHLNGQKKFLRDTLKDTDRCVVIDIGANVGDYCKAVITVNPNATIYAFEPHPKTYSDLQNQFAQIANVQLFNMALGNSREILTLYDYCSDKGSSHASIYKEVIEIIHGAPSQSYNVCSSTLDCFVKEKGIEYIDLLKIDTEGHEYEILKGAMSLINSKKIKNIHFEFNEMNVFSRTFFKDFWELLSSYKLYRLLPNGLLPIDNYCPLTCEFFAYQNIVAVLVSD